MTKFESLIAGLAALFAGLGYLGRRVRRLAKAVEFWTGLPETHQANTEAVERLTEEVAGLTVQVYHLVQIERVRAGQDSGA